MFPNVRHFDINKEGVDDDFRCATIINFSQKHKNEKFFNFLIKNEEQLYKSVKTFYNKYKKGDKIIIIYNNEKQLFVFYKCLVKTFLKVKNYDKLKFILKSNNIKCF